MSLLSSATVNTGRPTLFESFTVTLKTSGSQIKRMYINSGSLHGPLRVRVAQMAIAPSPETTNHTDSIFRIGFDYKVPVIVDTAVPSGSETNHLYSFPVPLGNLRLTNVTEFLIHDNAFTMYLDKSPTDSDINILFTLEFLQETLVKSI